MTTHGNPPFPAAKRQARQVPVTTVPPASDPSLVGESFWCDICHHLHPLGEHANCRNGGTPEVTGRGTDPSTPCAWCGQALGQTRYARTIHPECADQRAAEYVKHLETEAP